MAVVFDAVDSQPVSRPRMSWNNNGLDGEFDHEREAQLHVPELEFSMDGRSSGSRAEVGHPRIKLPVARVDPATLVWNREWRLAET
eukprot:16201391-Heterocapsa_arctica.AAC.2